MVFFYVRARPQFCQASSSVSKRLGILDFLGRGLPPFGNFEFLAFVVSVPMAALTKANQVNTPQLVNLGQCQVWPLPKRDHVVDYYAPRDLRWAFVHTVPATASLLLPDFLCQPLPFSGDIESVDIIAGDQG